MNNKDTLSTTLFTLSRARVAKTLGRRLRYLRGQLGVTQQTVAEAVGSDRSYIGKLERAELMPRVSTLVRIANYFGLDVSELLGSGPTPMREKR